MTEKLQLYASYKNINCSGLIYYLTSCFEQCFKQGNALLLFFKAVLFFFQKHFDKTPPSWLYIEAFFFHLGHVGFWERF